MTKEINDGGSAFPVTQKIIHDGSIIESHSCGMTLRDHFAGLAMSAMTLKDDGQRPSDGGRADMECKWVAKAAYRYADAMIAARSA